MRSPTVLGIVATLAFVTACGGSPSAPPSAATTPAPTGSEAAAPPASADAKSTESTVRYDVIFGDHVAGKDVIVTHADGSMDEDVEYNDRGRGPKLHAHGVLAADGLFDKLDIAGKDYLKRDVHETATCDANRCKWDSNDEHGEGPRGYYVSFNSITLADAPLTKLALKGGVKLLPGGTLRALKVADTTVKRGASESVHVNAIEIAGFGFVPQVEWYDDSGALFAFVGDEFAFIREGWKDAVRALLDEQRPLGRDRRVRLAEQVSHRAKRLGVVHARLFDPATKKVTPDATIVIEDGKVKAVGKLPAPKDAEILDAGGKTVLPGLWDMHVHVGDDDGDMNIANGITTVRDMGNDKDSSLKRRSRWDSGNELGPRLILAGFVDGHGPFEAPTKVFAETPAEATKVVDDYAADGYAQVKIYSSMKPELVPLIAKEAHAKGMRVSGHVPAHMIAEDAVNAGYDEIQHVNFVMLDVLATRDDDTRTPLRFTRVAEKGADLDLDGAPMKKLLDLLAQKKTVIDPTLNVFETMFTVRPDHPNPTLVPILARLPVQVQRQALGGALPVGEGMDAKYKEAFKRCEQLVKRLHDRKIPIVAGTDSWPGFALHRELELYVEAGIPNADVLEIATLGAARVMKKDATSGSIARGKDADLIIVDGDPLTKMSDVRNVVTVVRGGTVIDAVAAQKALSIGPR